jgi:hypothetical protein
MEIISTSVVVVVGGSSAVVVVGGSSAVAVVEVIIVIVGGGSSPVRILSCGQLTVLQFWPAAASGQWSLTVVTFILWSLYVLGFKVYFLMLNKIHA